MQPEDGLELCVTLVSSSDHVTSCFKFWSCDFVAILLVKQPLATILPTGDGTCCYGNVCPPRILRRPKSTDWWQTLLKLEEWSWQMMPPSSPHISDTSWKWHGSTAGWRPSRQCPPWQKFLLANHRSRYVGNESCFNPMIWVTDLIFDKILDPILPWDEAWLFYCHQFSPLLIWLQCCPLMRW